MEECKGGPRLVRAPAEVFEKDGKLNTCDEPVGHDYQDQCSCGAVAEPRLRRP
jgi:hypothetical protein